MPKGVAAPVAGYPSKFAAIIGLTAAGKSTDEIRDIVGCSAKEIYKARVLSKQRAAKAEGAADTRGIWTPDKIDKARRLFGKTMIYIAEALQVPADELMTYALKGILPPIGKAQRTADLVQAAEDRARDAAARRPPVTMPVLPAPPAAEPSRDDDEAELAALENQENEDDFAEGLDDDGGDGAVDGAVDGDGRDDVSGLHGEGEPAVAELAEPAPDRAATRRGAQPDQPPAPAQPARAREPAAEPPRPQAPKAVAPAARAPNVLAPAAKKNEAWHLYHLTDEAGQWLHESTEALTKNKRFAWKGTTKQIAIIVQRAPKWKVLVPERAA